MTTGSLIAIFCSSFPPEGGGASNRIYNLAVLLRDAGYRVQVVAAMPNYPKGKTFPAYRNRYVIEEQVDGIQVRRVWLAPSNSASAWSRVWSMASFSFSLRLLGFPQVLRMRPDLVIVSSPPLPSAAAAVRFFKKKGCRVLLNVSDIWPLSAKALGALEPSPLYRRLETMAQRMYARADAITTQSQETMEHIARLLLKMPPGMVYRNLPAKGENRPSAANNSTTVRIIYPGVLGHAQGLLSLCRAIHFARLGTRLDIYGDGPEREAIERYLQQNPDCGISLFNPVPPAQLAIELQQASAVLIPLTAPISGALPSKLFTAMHLGVPVLYSGGGEGEKIVLEHRLGWVAAPSDFAAITRNIESLKAVSNAELGPWRQEIQVTAERYFSKERQEQSFLSLVRQLLQG